MKPLILFKMSCQISFYLLIMNFFVVMLGGQNLIFTFPIFIIATFLNRWLKPSGLIRYASVLLLGLCFLVIPLDWLHTISLLPLFLYAVFASSYIDEKNSSDDYVDAFKRGIITTGALTLFAWIYSHAFIGELIQEFLRTFYTSSVLLGYQGWETQINDTLLSFQVASALPESAMLVVMKTVLPMFLIYFWCALMLLRIQAYHTAIKFPIKLKLVNTWLIGSILFIAVAAGFIGLRLSNLIPSFEFDNRLIISELDLDLDEEIEEIEEFEFAPHGRGLIVIIRITSLILAISGAIFIIWKLSKFRPQFKFKRIEINEDDVVEIREALQGPIGSKMRKKSLRLHENQVRAVYQKFLTRLQKAGIEVTMNMTSLDVEKLAQDKVYILEIEMLREIYTKVRYGNQPYSKEELKEIKAIYTKLRREMKK